MQYQGFRAVVQLRLPYSRSVKVLCIALHLALYCIIGSASMQLIKAPCTVLII